MPPQLRQMLAAPAYALQEIRLAVVSTVPKGVVHIEAETEVELRPEYEEPREHRRADVTYDDVGGMAETIDQLREMVELPLRYPELFQRLGVDPPRGVLQIGRAHVCTPVTNAHLVCRLLLEKKKTTST